jgi:hypothetical protein
MAALQPVALCAVHGDVLEGPTSASAIDVLDSVNVLDGLDVFGGVGLSVNVRFDRITPTNEGVAVNLL